MSEMDAVDPASAERSRVESETLPLVIQTVGGLSAAVGVISIALALTGIVPWLLGSGVSALLAAPFLCCAFPLWLCGHRVELEKVVLKALMRVLEKDP